MQFIIHYPIINTTESKLVWGLNQSGNKKDRPWGQPSLPYNGYWNYFLRVQQLGGTAVAQWLRCCATNRKVAGSIPAGVSGYFIDIKSFRSHYGPGVDSASNRNEYQAYFVGVKAAGA